MQVRYRPPWSSCCLRGQGHDPEIQVMEVKVMFQRSRSYSRVQGHFQQVMFQRSRSCSEVKIMFQRSRSCSSGQCSRDHGCVPEVKVMFQRVKGMFSEVKVMFHRSRSCSRGPGQFRLPSAPIFPIFSKLPIYSYILSKSPIFSYIFGKC